MLKMIKGESSAKHEGDVTVHRGGKVFHQKRMLRDDKGAPIGPVGPGGPVGPSKEPALLDSEKKESEERQAQFDKEVSAVVDGQHPSMKKRLNALGKMAGSAIASLKKVGDQTKITVGGKQLVIERGAGALVKIHGIGVTSLKGAALLLHGMEGGAATLNEHTSGVLHARTPGDGLQSAAQAVTSKVQEQKHTLDNKARIAHAERSRLISRKKAEDAKDASLAEKDKASSAKSEESRASKEMAKRLSLLAKMDKEREAARAAKDKETASRPKLVRRKSQKVEPIG